MSNISISLACANQYHNSGTSELLVIIAPRSLNCTVSAMRLVMMDMATSTCAGDCCDCTSLYKMILCMLNTHHAKVRLTQSRYDGQHIWGDVSFTTRLSAADGLQRKEKALSSQGVHRHAIMFCRYHHWSAKIPAKCARSLLTCCR